MDELPELPESDTPAVMDGECVCAVLAASGGGANRARNAGNSREMAQKGSCLGE